MLKSPFGAGLPAAGLAFAIASAVPAAGQDDLAFFPTGVVYQQARHIALTHAMKLDVVGVAQNHHGSYENEPYYAFLQDPATGKQYLVSDGRLKAELTPVPGSGGTRPTADGKSVWLVAKYAIDVVRSDTPTSGLHNPVLSINDPACGEQECFLVAGTDGFAELPPGRDMFTAYVVSRPKPNDTSQGKQNWGSAFQPRPNEPIYYMNGCWDVTGLDYLGYQNTRCGKALLALPDENSANYDFAVGNMALPYGWLYDSLDYSGGESLTTTISSSQDVMNAMQRTTGYNVTGSASASYGVVEVDTSFSFKSSNSQMQRFENMHADKTAFTQSQYHHTEFALVVDKINGDLDPGFRQQADELLVAHKAGILDDTTLHDLFTDWGTHYAYAVTYGTQGSATTTYAEQELKQLIEKGVKYSQAWEAQATVKVMGSGGTLGGGSSSEADKQMQNAFDSIMSSSDTVYVCSGGATCEGGVPQGTPLVPVFLDLRPISELFGPPYYSDPDMVLGLRDRVFDALQDYAFVELPQGAPDYGMVSLEFQPPVCNGLPCTQVVPNSTWSFDPVTVIPGQNDRFIPIAHIQPSADVAGGFTLDFAGGTPTATYIPGGETVSLEGSFVLDYSWNADPEDPTSGAFASPRGFAPLQFASVAGQTVSLVDGAEFIHHYRGPGAWIDFEISVPVVVGPADLGRSLGVN